MCRLRPQSLAGLSIEMMPCLQRPETLLIEATVMCAHPHQLSSQIPAGSIKLHLAHGLWKQQTSG